MKKYLGRLIFVGFLVAVILGAIGFSYHNYRVMQVSDPTFFSESTKHIPARKLVPKTFKPQRLILNQPPLTPQKRRIKRALNPVIGENKFVGTILLVRNGQQIYNQGYGYANFQRQGLNNAQSEYQILSMQKSLTATLVMQQIQAGRIKLTDRLAKYYPEVPGSEQITIRMMLNMMTGLRIRKYSTRSLSGHAVVDYAIHHVRFVSTLNHQWSYQPVNFTLLAGVLQQVTHKSYYQLFQTHLIKPLRLHHTGFVMLANRAKWLSTPYHNKSLRETTVNYLYPFHESPANQHNELATGNVYMNTADFYKTTKNILQGGLITWQSAQILHDAAGNKKGYAGGLYQASANSYWSHGLGYGEESGMMISKNGQNAVIMLSNYRRKTPNLVKQCHFIYQQLMAGAY